MEQDIILRVAMFVGCCIFAWVYFSTERSTSKLLQDKILLLENNTKAQISELKVSVDAQRTTLMNYKTAHNQDVMELQRACSEIKRSQRRISNDQFRLSGMVEAKASLVPFQVIEQKQPRAH